MLPIVLDTSVLAAAMLSRRGASFRLLDNIADPRWTIHLSAALVLEYEATAIRIANQTGQSRADVDAIISMLCSVGHHHAIHFRLRPALTDPEDDFVLELAFASRARYIVTHNIRDFRNASAFGVTAVTPGNFLRTMELAP